MEWYQKPPDLIFDELEVSLEKGLTSFEAKARIRQYGPNLLAKEKKETTPGLFLRQFKSPLIYILILASILVFALGDILDGLVILAVIFTNSIVGAFQEGKARNSLEKLRSLIKHKALVRRSGEELLISASEVVPGDILIIKEGERVSADARIVFEEGFKADEAILTGEAYAVVKIAGVLGGDNLVVGDQKNMVFAGTSAVSGYCEAVVVATGKDSELGKISKELAETSKVALPLHAKIVDLTHFIALAVFGIVGAIFIVGLARGIPFEEIFGAAVGMTVSLIPEGLPVAVTIVLAKGVWRMAKAKAIVRQMAAVEAMGNADTLLVDKTGTITSGKMMIREVYFRGVKFQVSGEGYEPHGRISGDQKLLASLKEALALCYLSLSADVVHDQNDKWRPSGDPTEVAIAVLCRKAGLFRKDLEKEYKTVIANPFDQEKRYIEAVFEKGKKKRHVFVGAPDFLSKNLKVDHGFLKEYKELAGEGMRVVGFAIFDGRKVVDFALFAIEEEIRESVFDSVKQAKEAGFRICMLTGDYPDTACAIAKKVGIFEDGDKLLTGLEIEKLSAAELAVEVESVTVFARITPVHKLKIVKAFQKAGKICAMTGDGVNDAPALQAANLGIGLGSGTQVAKDSADIVLVNDNFETIIDAISEGRAIYFSLKKVILYLFSTSFGEVLVIAGSILVGMPLPLVAVQIIWLNFVTDGFFVVALAQDSPTERGLVAVADVGSAKLVDSLMIARIALMGLVMLFAALPLFYFFQNNYSLSYSRSMALVILSVVQWFNAFNVRSRTKSIFAIPLNVWLMFAFFAVFILQILAIETDLGNRLLHTENLEISHWILAFFVSTLIIWVEEARKFFVHRRAVSGFLSGKELPGIKALE